MHMWCLLIRNWRLVLGACLRRTSHQMLAMLAMQQGCVQSTPGSCTINLVVQDAGMRLRAGASALKGHARTSQFFFAQLARLQQHWNIKRSPAGRPGHFQIDVALPLGRQWQLHRSTQQPDTLIDVIQVLWSCRLQGKTTMSL